MPLIYKPARAEDLVPANALVVATVNDLTEKHGFGAMASVRPPSFQQFSLADDPGGLWVAEDGGKIVGFVWSWICGDVWFLSQLFVDPAQQGGGIGNKLLELSVEYARKSGATHRALITFSFNRVSQGLYIRHGFFPKTPIYFWNAPRERMMKNLPAAPLQTIAMEDDAAHMKALAEIDTSAIGVSREKHHRYLRSDPTMKGFMLRAGGDTVGYAYASSDGHVGPLAVSRAGVLDDAFVTALKIAAEGNSPNVSAFLPGTCDSVLTLAVRHRMRITFPMLLMASPGFGDWTHYLPRNPGFM